MININLHAYLKQLRKQREMHKIKLPMVIVTGIDGSGKSTIVRLLAEHLRNEGYQPKQIWIKSLHTLASLISILLTLYRKKNLFKNPNEIAVSRFRPSDYGSMSKIWPLIESISVIPVILLEVFLLIFFGFTIIADRYVIDTIVMISTNTKNVNFYNSFLGRILFRMIPKGTITIYLDVDLDTVLRRRPDIEYTLKEIETQLMLYRRLAGMVGAYVIDTSASDLHVTMKEIFEKLPL